MYNFRVIEQIGTSSAKVSSKSDGNLLAAGNASTQGGCRESEAHSMVEKFV